MTQVVSKLGLLHITHENNFKAFPVSPKICIHFVMKDYEEKSSWTQDAGIRSNVIQLEWSYPPLPHPTTQPGTQHATGNLPWSWSTSEATNRDGHGIICVASFDQEYRDRLSAMKRVPLALTWIWHCTFTRIKAQVSWRCDVVFGTLRELTSSC